MTDPGDPEPLTLVTGERISVEIDPGPMVGVLGPDLAERLARAIIDVTEAESDQEGLVELAFVDPDTIAALKAEHLGGEGPTDVLSFPLAAPDDDDPLGQLDDSPVLGSIVLCDEVITAQAAGHVGDVDGERLLMVVHGALHLLGHDHLEDDEREVMQALEATHLARHGVVHPGDQAA